MQNSQRVTTRRNGEESAERPAMLSLTFRSSKQLGDHRGRGTTGADAASKRPVALWAERGASIKEAPLFSAASVRNCDEKPSAIKVRQTAQGPPLRQVRLKGQQPARSLPTLQWYAVTAEQVANFRKKARREPRPPGLHERGLFLVLERAFAELLE